MMAGRSPAPSLRYLSGRYNAQRLGAVIRRGSPGMPTCGEDVLSDAGPDDRVGILSDNRGAAETGSGWLDGHGPPPDPFCQQEVTGLERLRP